MSRRVLYVGFLFYTYLKASLDVSTEHTSNRRQRQPDHFNKSNALHGITLPSYGTVDIPQLDKIQTLVDEALVKIGEANKYLYDNPRRNTYDKGDEARRIQRHTQTDVPYAISAELVAAAALLAERDAYLSTDIAIPSKFLQDGAAPFWMEAIRHSALFISVMTRIAKFVDHPCK